MLSASIAVLATQFGQYAHAQSTTGPGAREDPQSSRPSRALRAIRVQGAEESAYGPDFGYAVERSASGTKTDTPLIETPQSISVITRDRIEAQNADDLGEVLRYTPGVQGEPFGFEPRLTFLRIRGLDATTTGLYRDGLQLRNPNFVAGYNLEPDGAERIEVPRGPASVLYGASNAGGLVNYISKRPTAEPFREIGLELGSFDQIEGKFDLSGPVDEEGAFSYRLTGLARDSDTQVDFIRNDRLFLAPAFTWRPSNDTSLTFLGQFQQDDTRNSQAIPAAGSLLPNPNGEIPVETFTGEPGVDRYDRTEYSAGYLFEHRASDALSFRQNARYYTVDLDDVSVFNDAFGQDLRTVGRSLFENFGELDGVAVDNQAQLEFASGPLDHSLLVGADYQHIEAASVQNFGAAPPIDIFNPVYGAPFAAPATPFTNSDQTQDQIGLYAQDQIRLQDRWVFQLGGRYDWADDEVQNRLDDTETEQSDNEFSGRAGVVYLSDVGLAPYFSYAESFLPVAGAAPDGTPFEPETGRQYEVGVKYQPRGVNRFVTVALFDLTRNNFTTTDPATFEDFQTGETRSRGIELEGVASFDFGLDLIATSTFMDVEVEASADPAEIGKRPTQVAEQLTSVWADYAIPLPGLSGLHVGAGVRYLGSSFGDAANAFKIPSETLFDAGLRHDWDNIQLKVHVQNILDEEHIASGFVRGDDNFITFGTARAVTGSIAYRW
ncbi:MAG: TonB-dependent siderophore receptor [Gammaproteobacteria bacterium]